MIKRREPISPHGRLFGGDSMYDVLCEIAQRGESAFNAYEIAMAVGRHPSQVQRDLDRLVAIRVLEPAPARGAARPLRSRKTHLARAVVSLPRLIVGEIGERERTAASADAEPARDDS